MKIIAIDPGYERLGIAIIEKEGKEKEVLVHSECFHTDKKLEHAERLFLIKKHLQQIVEKFKPESLAIETLYFSKNQKTALLVAEARGVILAEAKSANLKIAEFNPNEIKMAITSYGKSDKSAIIKLVPQLIKIEHEIKYDDEYDAIAIGLSFFAINRANF